MLNKRKGERKYGEWMTTPIYMTIKSFIRHNDKEGLADYLYRAMNYCMAHSTNADWTDPDRYICVDELPTLGVICPHCGEESTINLRTIAKEGAKISEGKSNREKIYNSLMEMAEEWNKTHKSKISYEFIRSLKERI